MKYRIYRYTQNHNKWLCGHVGYLLRETNHGAKVIAVKTGSGYKSFIFNPTCRMNVNDLEEDHFISFDNVNNTYLRIEHEYKNSTPKKITNLIGDFDNLMYYNHGNYKALFTMGVTLDGGIDSTISDITSYDLCENKEEQDNYINGITETFIRRNPDIFSHILKSDILWRNDISEISDSEIIKITNKNYIASNLNLLNDIIKITETDIIELSNIQNAMKRALSENKKEIYAKYRLEELNKMLTIISRSINNKQ